MHGVANRVRRFVVDGVPVATGLVALGDAQQCTDPSLGRGMTMGLMHTEVLRDVLREHDARSAELAVAYDAATRKVIGPWYDATVQNGQLRLAEMGAAACGERSPRRVPPPSPWPWGGRSPSTRTPALSSPSCCRA